MPVFPLTAVRYFLVALLCVAAIVAIVEWRLGALAREKRVASSEWQVEDTRINAMNRQKILSTRDSPLWRSAGIGLPGPRGPSTRRLLVLGDSFVWGDGYLNANDIWWRQLARELHKRGYWDVEVVAAGLNAASTQVQLRWLKETSILADAAADMVILGYVTNDPDVRDDQGERLVKQIGSDELPRPRWERVDRTLGRLTPHLALQLKELLTRKWESKVDGGYSYAEWELKLLEPPNIDRYRELVTELGTAVRALGKPFLVVTLPNINDADRYAKRYAPVRPIFESAGLRFFDLLEHLVGEFPETGDSIRWGINPANGHPGRISTRFYARKVADYLELNHPEVLGGRSELPERVRPEINDWSPPSLQVAQRSGNRWEFQYPLGGQLAPLMPIGEPHAALFFAEPVAASEIRLAGSGLRGARCYLSVVSPTTGVEEEELVELPPAEGSTLKWSLSSVAGAYRINAIRIVADIAEQHQRVALPSSSFKTFDRGGHGFFADVPQLEGESDVVSHPPRSPWVLLEDGKGLPHPHAAHPDINGRGAGRWSHWGKRVYFSTLDGSDPRSNGRRYELAKAVPESMRLQLEIAFDRIPIRP